MGGCSALGHKPEFWRGLLLAVLIPIIPTGLVAGLAAWLIPSYTDWAVTVTYVGIALYVLWQEWAGEGM